MWMSVKLLLLLLGILQTAAKPKNRFTPYPSWNTEVYPVWKDADPRYADSWKGGRVIFNVGNDSPTLTGAKVTFTIDLEFPHNQRVKKNGDVVWTKDCVVNGTNYVQSEPVYPAKNTEWEAAFPDGTPIQEDQKPEYVYVWKTWGRYWQVADGPSSKLTIETDDIPLGSYSVDIVIYHYRSKERFIPLGYASTQFSITDQIPFAVSLDQVNDIVAGDMHFVQNRAIAFTVTLHDPSQYLSSADITFNWDFGDASGALISRELTVTHTYVRSGGYKPKVVVQAVLPDKACDPVVDVTTDTPTTASSKRLNVNMVPVDTEEDNSEDEASTAHSAQGAGPEAKNQIPVGKTGSDLSKSAGTGRKLEGRGGVTKVTKRNVDVKPTGGDCVIYRYGSFCASIQVSDAIENVQIVKMDNAVLATTEKNQQAVDLTVTCQGSLPNEVCTVILDSECLRPIHASCNAVEPSRDCQLVLRHFFNDSGVYCIKVSVANDISLASTSAKVNVETDSSLSPSDAIIMVLGSMVVLSAAIIALSVRRLKLHHPLKEEASPGRGSSGCSTLFLWRLLSRKGSLDDCPLLPDGRV